MIYEISFVVKTETPDNIISSIKSEINTIVQSQKGETVLEDDWGNKRFAQPTKKGIERGRFFYTIFSGNGEVNQEIERKLRINENVLKYLVVKLGPTSKKDAIVKEYQSHSNANDDESKGINAEKEKKIFSKRKTCWFSAKKTQPDWKRPETYSWLVNDFGKISPARITGLRPRFQRMANVAIKRGRCMGLISYVSNQVAKDV